MSVKGKRLLVLGGTSASLDIVKQSKEMGVFTLVTDEAPKETRVAKQLADDYAMVSTTDHDALAALIKEKNIDGVSCGPSEFNIRNMIALCEKIGMQCYTDTATWNRCANKDEFTAACRAFGVDVPEEYEVTADMTDEALDALDYPIIIKPVDGCSSIGISVCRDKSEVKSAYEKAMAASKCKRIIAEKYIENGGELFGARYFIRDGEAFPYLLIDTYVADPIHRTSLISAYTQTPSKYSDYYLANMDANVRRMIKGMGIKNGTLFFQALPYKGKIYFHEMGYRLSGGMIFKLTEPLMGINDMKMMIRLALGGESITDGEIAKIDLRCGGRFGAQLTVPLNAGTVAKIQGLEESKAIPEVTDFIQYYEPGHTVEPEYIGSLRQHFGRFTIIADGEKELVGAVNAIQSKLRVYDESGEQMNTLQFDVSRMK